MKIHTNDVVLPQLLDAANHASTASGGRVTLTRADVKGSRSHRTAYDVALEGDGTLGRKRNASNTGIAATWAQWGHFLAALYRIDPTAKAGPYNGADDFHGATREAFRIED